MTQDEMFRGSMHISWTQRIIYKGWKKAMRELDPHFSTPMCASCYKNLKIGDYVDGQYPWNSEWNRCSKCQKKEKKK